MKGWRRRLLAGAGVIVLLLLLVFKSACSLLWHGPDQLSQPERLRQLPQGKAPVRQGLRIYWDSHSIPFIEAQNDADLAFALGVVHAHLRIDQIELLRVLSKAKLSELIGPIPIITTVDEALLNLDFQRAGQAAIAGMSPRSREWMEEFTRGLNWYVDKLDVRPLTHRLLGMELERFTLQEIAAISRLVSADLSWVTYFRYLRTHEPKLFEEFVAKRVDDRATDASLDTALLESGIAQFSRSGSNSVVVGKEKSATGAGLIASDPHVGLFLPNFWLLAGIKSPNYHAVGLMIPGVPILGEGRNMSVAWGGTNMRGISSHLYDVSHLPSEALSKKEHRIKRRGWFSKRVSVEHSPFGPVLSNLDFTAPRFAGKKLALDWLGHHPSDEIGAFLAASRARDWRSFEAAFAGYRVSAMNVLFADSKGDIGMVAAYGQPVLKDPSKTLDLVKESSNPRVGIKAPNEHPNPHNPEQGFLASANNKPFANPDIPISYSYANNDRYFRLSQWIGERAKVSVADLKKMQLDVYSSSAHALQQLLLKKLSGFRPKPEHQGLWRSFAQWSGEFDKSSRGAVVFFALMYELWQDNLASFTSERRKHLSGTDRWKAMLAKWIEEQSKQQLASGVRRGLAQAAQCVEDYPTWESFTVMTPQTVFGRLPLVGKRFRRKRVLPISGSSDTINKYGRALSLERVDVGYGASARHISDLSDPDANYFVLNGGQDGWIFNENIDDQLPLWQEGKYIQIPLRMESVRKHFSTFVSEWEPSAP